MHCLSLTFLWVSFCAVGVSHGVPTILALTSVSLSSEESARKYFETSYTP